MSFTEITPYSGLLPTSDDPASFDGRATSLMSWMVANFAPELQALAVEIATALNGEADTLTSLQELRNDLVNVAKTSPLYTDANDITESGFSFLQSTAANIPTAARYHIYTAQYGPDYIAQIAVRSSTTPEMYKRYSLYGVWGNWVRMARADELLGVGQTLQDVTGDRAVGTYYQNTLPRPIGVFISGWLSASEATTFGVGPSTSALVPVGTSGVTGGWRQNVSAIIPADWWYRLPSGAFTKWSELK